MADAAHHLTDRRIVEIDIAKAIGILLVFIGHRKFGTSVGNYIYLFHMPLFFILSGVFVREELLNFSEILFKDIQLLATYIVYSIIFVFYSLVPHFSLKTLAAGILQTVTFWGIDILWFLASLLLSKMILRFLFRIKKISLQCGIVIFLYVSGFFLSKLLVSLKYELITQMLFRYISWACIRPLVILVFLYIGFVLKGYILDFISTLRNRRLLAVLIALACAFALLPFVSCEAVDYHLLKNGVFVFDIFYGVTGTVLVLCISALIGSISSLFCKLLRFVGKNSVHFMASEYFGLSVYVVAAIRRLPVHIPYSNYVGFVIYFIILTVSVKIFCPYIDRAIFALSNEIHKLKQIKI